MRVLTSSLSLVSVRNALLLLILAVGLGLAAPPASGQVRLQVQDVEGEAGTSVSIPIAVEGLSETDVTAYEFAIPFDSSVVELTGVSTTDAVTPSAPTVNVEAGTLRVAFSASEALGGDGPLLTLKGTLTGAGTDRLGFQSLALFGSTGSEVASEGAGGRVTSTAPITGRIPDTSAQAGETIALPVQIDGLDGEDVTAYDLTLPFDTSVVEVTGVNVDGAVTPSAPTVNVTDGELRVSYSGTEALSGNGPLLTVDAQLVNAGSDVLGFKTADFFTSTAERVATNFASGIVSAEGTTEGIDVQVADVEGDAGEAVTIPIRTDTLDGQGVTAYQFTLPFDPSVLAVTGVDIAGTTTPAAPTTNVQDDEIRVSFSTTEPLSGQGTLLKLRGRLVSGGEDVLDFRNLQFFDGSANEVASTSTPGRVVAQPPSAVGSETVGGDGEVTFEGTGTSIVFSGVSGSGQVTVREFSSLPSDTTGISEEAVAETRYAISVEGDLSVGDGTEVRFDTSRIQLPSFAGATVYRRDSLGQGTFSAVSTQLDETAGELVATISSFSEFVIAGSTTPPLAAVAPNAISDTIAVGDSTTQSIQIENTATAADALDLTFEVDEAPPQAGPVEWLTVDPATGSVAPGGSQTIEVTVRAVSTPPGQYETTLQIASNDPEQDTVEVPVSLTIERPPVSLSNPSERPSPGSGVSVTLNLPSSIASTEATFFYQAAGARTFRDTTRDLSTAEDGGTVSFAVPGSAVTRGGTRYYVELSGVLPDGETPVQLTVPSSAPRRTAFLPAQLGQVQARGAFLPETYRMLAVPVGLGDRSVFEVLKAQYGSYDPVKWRVARWAPGASSYQFGEAIDPLRPGEAAWLVTADGDSLTVSNARSADASGPQSVRLGPGWSQIGTPFPFSVAWADVERPDAVRDPVAYDTTGYQFGVTTLRPWRGAFVFNAADSAVTIEIPPVAAGTEQASSRGKSLARAASEAGGYRLQMTASAHQNGQTLKDPATWVGFAEGADAGLGPKDRAKPPPIRSGVRLHVMPKEGPALARSLKPVSSEGASWDVQVDLNERLEEPQEVTIALDETGRRPSGFRRYVVDRDADRRLPVTNGSVSVTLTEETPTRHLRVIVGTEAFAKKKSDGAALQVQETKLRTNVPNPFAEATTLSYQLAAREKVQIAVYDVLGRRVQTLVDATKGAGVYKVEWRPGRAGGSTLASGIYFCRMTAGEYTATRKLVLVR